MSHPNPKEKWKNMRIMAYTGIGIMVVVTFAAFFVDVKAEILWPISVFWASVVGAYMGFSTAGDAWGRN